ncbi:hypothetical protein [Patulibacter sp. SYSU D01012]|uniref:hypothetical protein n=1 Tax=Patulibacter sp. SYSU D01012 TaxID=2817381 RepID=UPI001B3045AA|nr:hypothetical protein [Patulibacter sp. SYSU D01012]
MPGWPIVPVRHVPQPADAPAEQVTPALARLVGHGLRVDVRRDPAGATARGAPAAWRGIVHPTLARAGAAVAAWWGRDAFQAAAVHGPGGALALAGPSGAGKSTLAAAVALAGRTVVTDEVVVVEDGDVLAGAASLAVRADARALLPLPPGLRSAWDGRAALLPLGPAPPSVALRGWVHLAWGERTTVRPLGPGARTAALGAARLHGDARGDAAAFLRLATLPAWRLERPRTADGHAQATAALLELLG